MSQLKQLIISIIIIVVGYILIKKIDIHVNSHRGICKDCKNSYKYYYSSCIIGDLDNYYFIKCKLNKKIKKNKCNFYERKWWKFWVGVNNDK